MRMSTMQRLDQRIARVLTLISSRLDESLPVDQLAAEAHLSPFHFHRIWRAYVGEPIGETVRRLRIQRAASALAMTNTPVTAIALQAGFASSQAFSKAFRQMTGMAPSTFRASGVSDWRAVAVKPSGDSASVMVEIVTLEPFTVLAKRTIGAHTQEQLAASFDEVWYWAQEQGLLAGLRGIYGVPYDDPLSVPVSVLRHDACLDLGSAFEPPSHLHLLRLGGAEYAKVRVLGAYAGLDAAYQHLFGTWLQSAGREPADAPIFNHYINDPERTPEAALITDVYLPLKS